MKWEELLCKDRIRSFQKSTTSKDLRTEFEKDYHRIIGSASFRRLQDKTQVFPLDRNDFIRTRLTHSLEVSSFAKSLGQNISESVMQEKSDSEFRPEYKNYICDILQCAALIHDIGNPPFGHFGETAIQDWFKKNLSGLIYKGQSIDKVLSPQMKEDFYHFEGNAQALRVVSKLHFLVDENGMNLTKALLATIIKYPCSSVEINKNSGNIKDKKMGYFYAEREVFADIQKSMNLNKNRHPLTYILEAADDIAYTTADIEDAVKKGCITYTDLVKELKKYAENETKTGAFRKVIRTLETKYQKGIDQEHDEPELYAVQNWVVNVQGLLISSATAGFIKHYDSIMAGSYTKDLFAGTEGEKAAGALGEIAYRYAFTSKPIYKLEIAAETIYNFLLEKFADAVIYFDTEEKQTDVQKKILRLLSDSQKRIYFKYAKGKNETERLYLRLLLVTDFVSGMTDSYAKTLYQELNGID